MAYASYKQIEQLLSARKEFDGNSMFGRWVNDNLYAVFSWGSHWPLYVYCKESNRRLANFEKYSSSTSRHARIVRNNVHVDSEVGVEQLKSIISAGSVSKWVARNLDARK